MTDPKNLNKCCPTNDGNVGKAIHSLSNRIQYLERISSNIENNLDEEKSRAIDAENTLQQHIEEEQNRASTKEEEILLALNEEQRRAEAVESALSNVIESIPDAQILSDWNLSDSNARDFIKNKPLALDGKSAYELAVDNGFEGTEQEWLASLKGPQGIQGPIGPKGEQGPQGVLGPKGNDGTMTFEDLTEEQRESLRGPLGIQGPTGEQGIQGIQGIQGETGAAGADGHSPVVTASKSGSTTTIYVDGSSIATIEDGLDGQDGQNGTNGTNGTNGLDGITPHIDSTSKHWMIGSTDTGIVAEGQNGSNGTNGSDGVTPHIDSTTGNWFIGTTDTGVHAQGPAGQDGNVANLLQADWNLSDNTLVDYIKNKPTIPIVPTNVSSFTNDVGYLAASIDTNNNSYVDLGLPSGTLWATMNVGASSETDYGNYYKYGKGSTQYSTSDTSYLGTEEPLSLSVDTARQVMGGNWCTPTKIQFQELVDQCTWTLVNNNGVSGYNVSKNGNSIFFPLSGHYSSGTYHGGSGFYWSSTSMDIDRAYQLSFNDNNSKIVGTSARDYGYTVRGVINVPHIVSNVAITGDYNDLKNKPTIPQIWRGTQAQYDAITTPDDNTIYIITSAS